MASSSSLSFQERYDVFLSFRGEDTRNTFASYLYAALSAKQILTFMDHELERGDEISPTLNKAIEESKISVIIFSENYASSTWCLDELVHILECRKTRGQVVMPIFYGIDPSVVRKQNGSYGVAFAGHENSFMDRIKKVNQWRAALTEASNLCGLNSKDFRPEAKLVQRIVEDISMKLSKYLSLNHHFKGHPVGIKRNIGTIESLLSSGLKDVRIRGNWGMEGSDEENQDEEDEDESEYKGPKDDDQANTHFVSFSKPMNLVDLHDVDEYEIYEQDEDDDYEDFDEDDYE